MVVVRCGGDGVVVTDVANLVNVWGKVVSYYHGGIVAGIAS